MKFRGLPSARFLLLQSKSIVLPALFAVVAVVISVELYRYGTDVDPQRSLVPLFAYNLALIALMVFTYLFHQVRSEYWVIRDFFEGEKTGYVRRAADALRTPLTGVRWLSEMLMLGEMGELNPEQKDGLEKINLAAKRLIAQTEELLKVVKISGGLITYRAEPADLSKAVAAAVAAVRPFAESKEQAVALAAPSFERFRFDEKLVRHVLEVLLMNAVQLAARKGTIDVTVRADRGSMVVDIACAPVASGTPHAARRIGTAPGLDKAQREEYSDEVNMAVSYEIINAAKGELWVSQSERGILYSVALPVSHPSSSVL